MRKRPTIKKCERLVALFNEKHPVGSEVEYEEVVDCTGKEKHKVEHQAYVTNIMPPYATAVVHLSGRRGWVCVDHVTGFTGFFGGAS